MLFIDMVSVTPEDRFEVSAAHGVAALVDLHHLDQGHPFRI
jgi:hypothetical protein